MPCVRTTTFATLRSACVALLAIAGACAESPNLPDQKVEAPARPSGYVLPGVTGTACRGGYISDGAGGCIYAPVVDGSTDGGGGGATQTGTGTSGGSTTSPPPENSDSTANAAAFSQGPIAWAACVLALAGTTVSVLDVADKFKTWHAAWQDARGLYELWQVTIQNNASPEMQQLYEYQYKQARQRQEDAKSDVSSATNVSYIALGSFAVACGALALAPTP